MTFTELLRIVDAVIASVQPDTLSNESIYRLQSLFPENLILAALDLIDRQNVIKYTTPWGYVQYEVLGSTTSYSVFLDMPMSTVPFYCTCPAFSYAVLLSETHLMCKHVLATRLARQMSFCVERPLTPDDLAFIMLRQYTELDIFS